MSRSHFNCHCCRTTAVCYILLRPYNNLHISYCISMVIHKHPYTVSGDFIHLKTTTVAGVVAETECEQKAVEYYKDAVSSWLFCFIAWCPLHALVALILSSHVVLKLNCILSFCYRNGTFSHLICPSSG